jgi:hypothetical protein
MSEIVRAIIDEQIDDKFIIDSAEKADWAIEKIAEHRADLKQYEEVCNQKIHTYKQKILDMQKKTEGETRSLVEMLRHYFESIPHKATKTMDKVLLPSGTLIMKRGTPAYIRDETKLGNWLQSNNYIGCFETVYKPLWDKLKKDTQIVGNTVVDPSSGIVIEGVTVVQGTDEFEVKI